MSILNSTQVARLRRRAQQYFNQTCVITRIDEVQGRLGLEESPVQVAAGVACRVVTDTRSQGQGYQAVGQAHMNVDAYIIWLPSGTDVDVAYQIAVDARVYDVIELLDDLSNEIFVEVRVRRVR